MQKYGNLSPPPSPSPVKGEEIFDFLRDHQLYLLTQLLSQLSLSPEFPFSVSNDRGRGMARNGAKKGPNPTPNRLALKLKVKRSVPNLHTR